MRPACAGGPAASRAGRLDIVGRRSGNVSRGRGGRTRAGPENGAPGAAATAGPGVAATRPGRPHRSGGA